MNRVKIILTYGNQQGGYGTESVWAVSDGDYYRIDNIPFLAPNIALNDLVDAKEDEGELHFERLVDPSGHSTIQIVFFDKSLIPTAEAKLENLGCAWEESHLDTLISVDVPKQIEYAPSRPTWMIWSIEDS